MVRQRHELGLSLSLLIAAAVGFLEGFHPLARASHACVAPPPPLSNFPVLRDCCNPAVNAATLPAL